MRNTKGISLIKVIIIVVVIILGIVFIVKMSEPQNGIGTLEEETEEWEKTKDKLNKANQNLQEAEDNYYKSLQELREAEEKSKYR